MPWQGDHSNVIDRFDVRAHLDIIPEVKNRDVSTENLSQEERNCNYERYRILAQNLFLSISTSSILFICEVVNFVIFHHEINYCYR